MGREDEMERRKCVRQGPGAARSIPLLLGPGGIRPVGLSQTAPYLISRRSAAVTGVHTYARARSRVVKLALSREQISASRTVRPPAAREAIVAAPAAVCLRPLLFSAPSLSLSLTLLSSF
jgi:hypothetical protein